jgi:competence protein ComFC
MSRSLELPWIRSWLDAALAFFYPPLCQICAAERSTPAEGYVGIKCWQQVRFITAPFCERCGLPFAGDITQTFTCGNCRELDLHFAWARSAVEAKGMVRQVIHRYKYRRAQWFEPFLADLLVRQAAPHLERMEWDCIVPVPLHELKYREREFNQAERLASHLSHATGIPMRNRLIQRVQPTSTQTKLGRAERATNVRHAFAARAGAQLQGESVILVDDVFTTGATTDACARILQAMGSGKVGVWTVARGI